MTWLFLQNKVYDVNKYAVKETVKRSVLIEFIEFEPVSVDQIDVALAQCKVL